MTSESSRVLTGRRVLAYLVAFFGVVFAVNGVMIKIALDTMPGLEVDSAYRASLAFNGEARAAQAQAERGWRVDAHVARDADGRAALRIEARDRAGTPLGGLAFTARLAHPADRRLDREVVLAERETGIYRATVDQISAGQWDLVLEAEWAGACSGELDTGSPTRTCAKQEPSLFKSRDRVMLQ